MSAPITFPNPTSKLVFERSSFTISKFNHENSIKRHYLNCAVSLILPKNTAIPPDVRSLLRSEQTYLVRHLPLSALIAQDFIGAFIKKGELCMLSSGTRIDQHDCVAIIPSGKLILNVTKDTYEQLGLEGRPSAFSKKKPTKYVIEINVAEPHFKPGNKPYERVKWAFTERLDLKFDFLCTWTPPDTQICSSSIAVYFANKDYSVGQMKIHDTSTCIDGDIPCITSSVWECDETCDYMEMYEWIGAVACRCDMKRREYVSNFFCPKPSMDCPYATLQTHGGMFSSKTLIQLLKILRAHLKADDLPWCTMTVHGFTDSPVSWDSREHGCFNSGENGYTYVLFPNDEYWLYSAVGSQDIVP